MPNDTLVGDLADVIAHRATRPSDVVIRPVADADRTALAQLYLDSYPPGVAVDTIDDALTDIDATFAGDYGELWREVTLVAVQRGDLVGSIQIVRQSPWDPDLPCPFIIELFVRPSAQNQGIGAALLHRSASICLQHGQTRIALRTAGDAASPFALRLYRSAGLRRHPMPSEPVRIVRERDPAGVEAILQSLPDWFGVEDAINQYVRDAADPQLDSLIARTGDRCVGVALIRHHYPEASELHLIAVAADQRRTGVGRLLVERVVADLARRGARLMSVHTVGPSFRDDAYAQTRAFYRSQGFIPLEEHRQLDWSGPTLILVKALP